MAKQNKVKEVVRNLRRALNYSGLNEDKASLDPFEQFEAWMKDAVEKESFEPNAMTLATASKKGIPTARTVLLKDYGPEGFVFFTNFNSRKGKNLTENSQASLVFYWGILSRQVLIDGEVIKTNREGSVEYFHSRPRKSQIAAYISSQSEVVASRQQLETQMKAAEAQFKGKDIPCPEHWGGFCLVPRRIEFWQGRPDRLHDRLCYTKVDAQNWKRERLAP
ncbi:MAG: pyridoxamine 5'-phosphate oxidase [Candidatus Omnitrophica bacterium]|nr:pyridoxamine 5'-phosphate oxidase [Candidatus Omnitrophota bacterium]MCB9748048.1 pyridoxamine 5'-phosphate oxidase [Candidatus Omnitrophota bacterium]